MGNACCFRQNYELVIHELSSIGDELLALLPNLRPGDQLDVCQEVQFWLKCQLKLLHEKRPTLFKDKSNEWVEFQRRQLARSLVAHMTGQEQIFRPFAAGMEVPPLDIRCNAVYITAYYIHYPRIVRLLMTSIHLYPVHFLDTLLV